MVKGDKVGGDIVSGDRIVTGNIENSQVVIGRGATGTFTTQQIERQDAIDVAALAEQLVQLQAELKTLATSTENFGELLEVAKAREALETGDKRGAFERLAKVGRWSLDTATAIGVRVAAEAIKVSIGL